MRPDNYTYETKCRRCGGFHDWYYMPTDRMPWVQFAQAMDEFIQNPRLLDCGPCEKQTVQDVVAYTEPFVEEE